LRPVGRLAAASLRAGGDLLNRRAGVRVAAARRVVSSQIRAFLQTGVTDLLISFMLSTMNVTERVDAVWFTTKGRVVIPLRLRKQFHIENGTKAVVQATAEGILLKPVTAVTIRRLRGILKRKPRR
jgi:AbrB family looped-hinge helix DNA binding protein